MSRRDELLRITATMTVASAIGAAVLGGVYLGTERYAAAARLRSERGAITELLALPPSAQVTEVRQYLKGGEDAASVVLYEARPLGAEAAEPGRAAFSLDGRRVALDAPSAPDRAGRGLEPLGRLFVARDGGRTAGFVVEGDVRGYKNRIRFLVGLTTGFDVAGVRVVEHEEDPGLGAEVATRGFEDQFYGRSPAEIESLGVTRDPMPEDWRAALLQLERVPGAEWRRRHGGLFERERGRPIYAVTGATISSRALTTGVQATVEHFRRRWSLLESWLGGRS